METHITSLSKDLTNYLLLNLSHSSKFFLSMTCKCFGELIRERCKHESKEDKYNLIEEDISNLNQLIYYIQNIELKRRNLKLSISTARSGNVEILKYLESQGYEMNKEVCIAATKRGNLEALKWSIEYGKFGSELEICREAAESGYLDVVKWLYKYYKSKALASNIYGGAAGEGHLNIIEYAESEGYGGRKLSKYISSACEIATHCGHLNIVEWGYHKGYIKLNEFQVWAIHSDWLNMIKWAESKGCKWNEQDCLDVLENCEGHIDTIIYFVENNMIVNESTIRTIFLTSIEHGKLNVISYLAKQGYPMDIEMCDKASFQGNLNIVKHLIELGCPYGPSTCANSVYNDGDPTDDPTLLMWLRKIGCSWDERTCINAVETRFIKTLKWARRHGCPLSEECCYTACKTRNLEILKYLRKHKCPWNRKKCLEVADDEIIRWIRMNK